LTRDPAPEGEYQGPGDSLTQHLQGRRDLFRWYKSHYINGSEEVLKGAIRKPKTPNQVLQNYRRVLQYLKGTPIFYF
jgi:hypothetical protein